MSREQIIKAVKEAGFDTSGWIDTDFDPGSWLISGIEFDEYYSMELKDRLYDYQLKGKHLKKSDAMKEFLYDCDPNYQVIYKKNGETIFETTVKEFISSEFDW